MTVNEPIQQEGRNKRSKNLNYYVATLTVIGILGVVAGLIHLFRAMSSGFSNTSLADVLFNTAFGVLILICSRILAKGKLLAIWFFGACILMSLIYSYAMGRGFNFVIAAVGAYFLWQLYSLKKQGELS
ncbi:MAG: MotA/TolQ/ExbB proton channel family protein [Caldilineales bacterium]